MARTRSKIKTQISWQQSSMNSQFCRKWQIARFENHPGQTPFGPAGTVEENRTGVSSDELGMVTHKLDEMSLDKIIEYIYTSSPNL